MTDMSIARLRSAYSSGRTRPLTWRREQLDAMRRMVVENREDFVAAVAADLGKPAAETVLMELNLVADEARFVRNRLGRWAARQPKPMPLALQPAAGWTVAEPKGVVLVIAPWNYPVLLALAPLADAIAAGNAVCLKPSELAPNAARLLSELVPQYLDCEAVRVIEGGPKETGELLKEPFDHIFYTGGERVGRIVMKAAAENLTPVTLELGGKSPCFVDRTADINVAARRIVWGKFTNAGQTCVAPDYVLATPDVAEALARRIAVAITEFFGENPQDSRDYGRIINDRHMERLIGLLSAGTVPPETPSSPLVVAASAVGAAMDMVGRRINAGVAAANRSGGNVADVVSALASGTVPAADDPAHAAETRGGVENGKAISADSGAGVASTGAEPADDGIQSVPGVTDPAGRVICGGKVDRDARYIAPTVLYGTQPDAPVMREEIFGPILPILVVRDADAAIRFINGRSKPLAAYVFSRDHAVRLAFERRTSSGALGFNLPLGHLLSSRLPFGGVGLSGMGAYHGKAGFDTFSHVKTVVVKPQFPDTLRAVYPPFTEAKHRLFDLITRLS
ncbi:aldehyde dehydrogenase family protein [Bifidobacterium sp. SO4]|uniref:aldehyde dehydrogenase family protein n=1 Tax=Bifidobacterium sp. SO4 TaxID=2809030 RepID=UPI001BDCA54D|nr:aldehyde dehydrogenase family protein [Bifidobacterium sp. SO4]MBT1170727.1 aldehyde dehydrogenase family protein [Bifidobacterium sp. SO4]